VEDYIMLPALEVSKAEDDMQTSEVGDKKSKSEEGLSKRELDIIKLIAIGLSNKEIAEELCLSTHTVMSHRKNIARKLDIHSTAGLTIYAVVNGIIEINQEN
jgi:regulator of cell morphogenesis and NO signaling